MHTVLSSTWRLDSKELEFHKHRFALKGLHIAYFHGLTSFNRKDRGLQILGYVKEHNIGENFFILDDDDHDIKPHVPEMNMFTTKFMQGLTNEVVGNVIKRVGEMSF